MKTKRIASQKELDSHKYTLKDAQPGDILLFYRAVGLNRLITWFTHSPFYHAALYSGPDEAVEARVHGVVRDRLKGREKDCLVIPALKEKGKPALEWAQKQIGEKYDGVGLIDLILDRLFRTLKLSYSQPNKFTCGEFVARAFDNAGVQLFPESKIEDVVPGDFARLLPESAFK